MVSERGRKQTRIAAGKTPTHTCNSCDENTTGLALRSGTKVHSDRSFRGALCEALREAHAMST